ncbi:MAG TPA: hypothetical protein VLG36_05570 [Candidatus Chromulinivoraceae bacterium]|nr:hypothetical protein [Candidatus Chromulinivoraceae bacterium]
MAVKYFANIDGVKNGTVGRQLQPLLTNEFEDYRPQVQPGEHLYMLLTGILESIMVLVDSKSEYDHFYGQYRSGAYVTHSLYALPATAVR